MRNLLVFVVFLSFAFAKAQSLQDLIPKIEERPREITDTLNREYDNRVLHVPELSENLREQYNGNEFNYIDESANYRNAIRYLYLDSLKNLSASNKIDWDFQKTNSDYYRELKDPTLKNLFKKVSYLYDYVWYGEFDLNETSFKEAQSEFESLKNQLI